MERLAGLTFMDLGIMRVNERSMGVHHSSVQLFFSAPRSTSGSTSTHTASAGHDIQVATVSSDDVYTQAKFSWTSGTRGEVQ